MEMSVTFAPLQALTPEKKEIPLPVLIEQEVLVDQRAGLVNSEKKNQLLLLGIEKWFLGYPASLVTVPAELFGLPRRESGAVTAGAVIKR
jgi:hypothetical protein